MHSQDILLRRRAAAAALTEAGFPTAAATLAAFVCRGGGPPFRRYGKYPLYKLDDLIEWAQARLGPPIRSSSEADAARRSAGAAG
jgi:hypothetical protein